MSKTFHHSASPFALGLFLLALLINAPLLQAQTPENQKLENAISRLRNVKQNEIPENKLEEKGKEIDAAWDVIRAAGQSGVARLKEELRRVETGKESDDYFKLNAGALLWIIGKLNEAEAIANIWKSTPLKAQYNYVFYTAMEAAATQDARALPMLKAVLRDDEGSVYLYKHSLNVRWPQTIQFIWGAYGSKGFPVLAEVLETSNFSVELRSTMWLLASSFHTNALPKIRTLAKSPIGGVRAIAIRSLGIIGHPQDYEILAAGLRLENEEELYNHVYALYEYDDLRPVPLLIPHLKNENEFFRREVIVTLINLSSPASFDALQAFCRAPTGEQQKDECRGRIDSELKKIDISWETYGKMSTSEKEKFFQDLRSKTEEEYKLKPDDKKLNRVQLLEALMEWKTRGRAFDEGGIEFSQPPGSDPNQMTARMFNYGWVEERHILSVATPQDRDLLLDVSASIYKRLSDEGLSEVERINNILKRLMRSQYRKVVGLADKIEAK